MKGVVFFLFLLLLGNNNCFPIQEGLQSILNSFTSNPEEEQPQTNWLGSVAKYAIPLGMAALSQSSPQKTFGNLLSTFLGSDSSLSAPDIPHLSGNINNNNQQKQFNSDDNGGIISKNPIQIPHHEVDEQSLIGTKPVLTATSPTDVVGNVNDAMKMLGVGSLEDIELDPVSKMFLNNIDNFAPHHSSPITQVNLQQKALKDSVPTVTHQIFDATGVTIGPGDPMPNFHLPPMTGVPFFEPN
eukprot:c20967_g1_i1.p1 GENE.c20967_g1_i1~~c20967_g1_i1.p1  ORF type:complete len:262 (+),score=102.94 c20967_g1_i1:61-786(+)